MVQSTKVKGTYYVLGIRTHIYQPTYTLVRT